MYCLSPAQELPASGGAYPIPIDYMLPPPLPIRMFPFLSYVLTPSVKQRAITTLGHHAAQVRPPAPRGRGAVRGGGEAVHLTPYDSDIGLGDVLPTVRATGWARVGLDGLGTSLGSYFLTRGSRNAFSEFVDVMRDAGRDMRP